MTYDVTYEILTPASLRADYVTLTDKIIHAVEGRPGVHLFFLDKSARPVAWLMRALWPVLARQPGTAGRLGSGVVSLVATAFVAGSTLNLPNDLAAAKSAGTPRELTVSLAALHLALGVALLGNAVPGLSSRVRG